MINMLDRWMDSSIYNFNIFVGVTMVLAVISIIGLVYFYSKMGKPDERTYIINLKILKTMFRSLIVLLGIYISWVDKDIIYFRQYLIFIITLTFFIGAITAAIQYKKDFY